MCFITLSSIIDSCWEKRLVFKRLKYMAIIKIQIAVIDMPLWLWKYSSINRALIHFMSCDLSGRFTQPCLVFSEAANLAVVSMIHFFDVTWSSHGCKYHFNTFFTIKGLKPNTVLQKCRHYNLLRLVWFCLHKCNTTDPLMKFKQDSLRDTLLYN